MRIQGLIEKRMSNTLVFKFKSELFTFNYDFKNNFYKRMKLDSAPLLH